MSYDLRFRKTENDPGLVDCDGYTDCTNGVIVIAEELTETRARDALVHELLHAIFDGQGVASYLKTLLKRGVKYEDAEENLIRSLTPAIITSFRSAGLLSRKKIKP